jgi:hypothetical protein
MQYYMLLLRSEKIDFGGYSADDVQQILADFDRWNAAMIRDQKLVASGSLDDGKGRLLRGELVVKDGPFSEVRETITGFFLIRADGYEDAATVASGCPFLARGGSVEVRLVPELEFEDVAGSIVEAQLRRRDTDATGRPQ